jgi:hypothetical protein
MKFLLSVGLTGAAAPFLLRWGRNQAEEQIDKMQAAVFNSPGAEAPIPTAVVGSLLGLSGWQKALSLLLGGAAGAANFYYADMKGRL